MNRLITSRVTAAVAATALLLLSGCASKAPPYQPSLDNLELLKKAPKGIAVGSFSVAAGATGATAISIRAANMGSPVGADYAAYLAEALRQELVLAGKLDPKSSLEISGVLLKNDIEAGGFSTNTGEIEARFTVRNGGTQRYEKVHRASLIWESSFAGAIAIPKAHQQYPLIVQKLLSQLLADADFQAAIR